MALPGERVGPLLPPADILAAWRATERLHNSAPTGSIEATELHAEMRRLMDEYEWAVRGRVQRDGGTNGRR